MRRPILVVALAGGMALTAVPAQAAAAATHPLACSASSSPIHPVQYSHVKVKVKSTPRAWAAITAHYKTTDTRHHANIGSDGVGDTTFNVSGATAGYKVGVTVTVTKGDRTGHCRTYLIPRKR